MNETTPKSVTQLLAEWSGGDREALAALMPLIYDELRRLAHSYMRQESTGHTLQTTALVHEAYLRLIGQRMSWTNRAHFYCVAAQMMRRVLVDHAKGQKRAKRGAGAAELPLEEAALVSQAPSRDVVALDEALRQLEAVDAQRARIVELRYFGGLSNEETSKVLGISTATIQRQWAGARAWLRHELRRRD